MRLFPMIMLALLGFVIASQTITAQTENKLSLSAGEATYQLDGPPTTFGGNFPVDINTRPFDFAYGDIDDDGLLDRLVVSPNFVGTPYDAVTPILAGVVFVEFGDQFREGLLRSGSMSAGSRIVAPKSFGLATTVAVGDLNGDGIDDVVIGASARFDDDPGEVSIVFGPVERPVFGPFQLQLNKTPPDASIVSPDPSRAFGYWVRIGDITGDGVNDLLVGTQFEPRIYIYAGPIEPGRLDADEADVILEDRQRFLALSSFEVADVTGDGVPDLIVSNTLTFDNFPSPGVRVIRGPIGGPGLISIEEGHTILIEGPRGTAFGRGLAVADLNSDGEPDLLIGEPAGGPDAEGIVHVVPGPLRTGHIDDVSMGTLVGERPGDWFGASSIVRDVTDDGVPDITILASQYDIGSQAEDEDVGRLYIFEGARPVITELRVDEGQIEILGEHLTDQVTLDGTRAEVVEAAPDRVAISGVGQEVRVVGFFGSVTSFVAQSVQLLPGWNLIGFTGGGPVGDLTEPIANRTLSLFSWSAAEQTFLSFRPSAFPPLNTLEHLAPFSGLWLNVSQGPPIVWQMPAAHAPRDVALKTGFNLVMWTGTELAVSEAIAPIASSVRSLFVWDPIAAAFLSFSPSAPGPLNTAKTLQPGQGVWINVAQDVVWRQPAAVSDGGSPEPAPAEPAVHTTPLAESVSEAERAVVLILTSEGSGSGFVVSDTEILTNAHVVVGFDQVDLVFVGGAVRSGAVKALDLELDVAVIEVVGLPVDTMRIDWQSAEQPAPATRVWTWGFPFGLLAGAGTSATVTTGIVSAIQTDGTFSFIQTDAAVNAGNSGGPLIIEDGRAVGINSFILVAQGEDVEGLNFAIDIATHRERIQALLRTTAATPTRGGIAADGRIAFGSDRNGDFDIYVINPDRTDLTRLTSGPGNDNGPIWSPSGSRILFYSDRDGDTELYVMNADGSGQTRLTESPDLDWFGSWSPDGTQIAFTTNRNGNPDIYLMNADGSGQRPLVVGPSIEAVPDWSPDGSLIVFHSDRNADARNVFVMKSDGSEITRLTTSVGDD